MGTFAFIEGFDDYKDFSTLGLGMLSYWTQSSRTGAIFPPSPALNAGRFGARCLTQQAQAGSTLVYSRALAATIDINIGFALLLDTYSGIPDGVNCRLLSIRDASSNAHFNLAIDKFGQLKLLAPNGNVVNQFQHPLVANVWNFVELLVHLDAAAGTAQLRVNGEQSVQTTGVVTKANANAVAQIVLECGRDVGGAVTQTLTCSYDDMYVRVDATDFLGEARALLVTPASDSAVQWTKLGGASNASQVQEQQADGDTTYNSSSTVGQVDLFNTAALAGNPTKIFGFQLSVCAKKSDSDTRQITTLLSIGGTSYDVTPAYLTTNYVFLRGITTNNPATGAAWQVSDFTAGTLKFGYRLAA